MSASQLYRLSALIVLCGVLGACQPPPPPPPTMSKQSPVALRAMQIRAFDTTDKRKVLHAVIAALQDLGYGIVKVDYASGTATAAKLERLRLTAAIYPHGQHQCSVRANAMVLMATGSAQVDDPEFYQKYFFEPLSNAMFLSAGQIEDDPAAPMPATPTESELAPGKAQTVKSKDTVP